MKTYSVVTAKTHPEFVESLSTASTDILAQLASLPECSTIILEDDVYNKLLRHPGFTSFYYANAAVCPFAKAFLFGGVWYASDIAVSPLLIATSMINVQ